VLKKFHAFYYIRTANFINQNLLQVANNIYNYSTFRLGVIMKDDFKLKVKYFVLACVMNFQRRKMETLMSQDSH
jgi:hypothetical protein